MPSVAVAQGRGGDEAGAGLDTVKGDGGHITKMITEGLLEECEIIGRISQESHTAMASQQMLARCLIAHTLTRTNSFLKAILGSVYCSHFIGKETETPTDEIMFVGSNGEEAAGPRFKPRASGCRARTVLLPEEVVTYFRKITPWPRGG